MLFPILLFYYFLFYTGFQWLLPGAHLLRFLIIIMAGLWLLSGQRMVKNRLLYALLLLIPVMLISIPGSYLKSFSLESFIGYLKILAIVILTIHAIDNPKRLGIFLATLLVVHIFLAKGSIGYQGTADVEMARIGAPGLASTSFLGDPNDFALALNIIIPFAFFFFLYVKNKLLKLGLLGTLLIYVGGVVVTSSRAGFITLLATVGLALLRSKRTFISLFVLFTLGLGMVVYAPAGYFDRMETSTSVEEGDTGYARIQFWKAGLYMMLENPVTGVGLGAFPSAFGSTYSHYVHHYADKWQVAHNSYITMGAELGVVGLIIYIYIIYLIFKQNAELRRRLLAANQKDSLLYTISNAITISLVAYVVGSTFLTACYYPHLYLLLSLTVALGEITRRELALAPESDIVSAPGRPTSVLASSHG